MREPTDATVRIRKSPGGVAFYTYFVYTIANIIGSTDGIYMRRKIRSDDRLVFAFRQSDTAMGVKRSTVRKLAAQLGTDETGFLHLAAATFVRQISRGSRPNKAQQIGNADGDDDARLTDEEIAAIKRMVPQNAMATRSFLDLIQDQES